MHTVMQVGKAWLYLSKAYQNYGAGRDAEDAKEKSEAALFRCNAVTVCTNPSQILFSSTLASTFHIAAAI